MNLLKLLLIILTIGTTYNLSNAKEQKLTYYHFITKEQVKSVETIYKKYQKNTKEKTPLKRVIRNARDRDLELLIRWLTFTNKLKGIHYSFKEISNFYLTNSFNTELLNTDQILSNAIKTAFKDNVSTNNIINFLITIKDRRVISFMLKNNMSIRAFKKHISQNGGHDLLNQIIELKEQEIAGKFKSKNLKVINKALKTLKGRLSYEKFLVQAYCRTRSKAYINSVKGGIKTKYITQDANTFLRCSKYLIDTNRYQELIQIMQNADPEVIREKKYSIWKGSLKQVINKLLFDRQYDIAYTIVKNNIFPEDTQQYRFNEFWAGFIALKYLKQHQLAIRHFTNMNEHSQGNVYSLSKSSYFLYRTYTELNQHNTADLWLKQASHHPKTFYGQLGIIEFNKILPALFLGEKVYSSKTILEELTKQRDAVSIYFDSLFEFFKKNVRHQTQNEVYKTIDKNILIKTGFLLAAANRPSEAYKFLKKTLNKELTEIETSKVLSIIYNDKNSYRLYSRFSSSFEYTDLPFFELYTIIPHIIEDQPKYRASLVHAISKHESNFILDTVGKAGEIGLMQIMPSTGKHLAKMLNTNFSKRKLANPKVNLRFGNHYIKTLIKKFKYAYPLAISSYNAGPTNVTKWINHYGEIETLEDIVDFIELIPFSVTRNYVKRVMEMEGIYSYLISKQQDIDSYTTLDL